MLFIGLDTAKCAVGDEVMLSEQLENLNLDNFGLVQVVHPLIRLDVCESDLRKEDVPWLVDQLGNWFPMLKQVTAALSTTTVEAAGEITAALLLRHQVNDSTGLLTTVTAD
jgi:hypothetical protein